MSLDLPFPPPRARDTHKGAMGRAVLIGGSAGMAGAMHLAVGGALRAGPGYVTALVPERLAPGVHLAHPEALVPPLEGCASWLCDAALELAQSTAEKADAVALGPGMGQHPQTATFLLAFLRALPKQRPGLACVLDADALNLLAQASAAQSFDWQELADLELLLTPHPGEADRLLRAAGRKVAMEDRSAVWRQLAELSGACIVLKGADSLIGEASSAREAADASADKVDSQAPVPEGPSINPSGNPGMASAGSGDVLTGILVGLLARGMQRLDAARLGAWLHGRAGDLAAQAGSEESLIASDLIDSLPLAWRELMSGRKTS